MIESFGFGRVLVTGATGFLGRHVVRHLLARPRMRVRVLVRSKERLRGTAGVDCERMEIALGDLTEKATFRGACQGVDAVFHCAALSPTNFGRGNRLEDFGRINEEGTAALANDAQRAGVKRFIFVSSTAAMGTPSKSVIDEETSCRPDSPYQRSKRNGEVRLLEMCRDGFPAVILRPCLITGEGKVGGELLKLFRLCRRGIFPVFGHRLDVEKPLVFVEDVVQVILRAAVYGRPGEVYLVHSGGRYTLGQILHVAGRLVGNPRPYINIPLPLAHAAARFSTPLFRIIGRVPPLSPERLTMYLADRRIVIDKARKELGYEPCHQDLEEILGHSLRDFVRTGQLEVPMTGDRSYP